MEFGQLPAKADGPVFSEYGSHIFQRVYQLVGRFVKYHGTLFVLQGLQVLPAAFLGGGEETFKAEAARCLAGNAQRGNHGTGAGNGTHGNARGGALLHQILAGIGDGGASRIGNQGAGLAGQDPLHDHIALKFLVVLKVADKAFFNAQMV